MRELCSIAKAPYLILFFILTTFGCSHNNGSVGQGNTFIKQVPTVISIRNPDFVIRPPVTFTWLPEPSQAFEDPRSKEVPIQDVFRMAISESLASRGYHLEQSTSAWKSQSSSDDKRADIEPKDLILVKEWEWAGPSFGASGLLKTITLDNRSKRTFTDLRIRIDYLGTTGPKEGYGGPTSIFVIQDTLPAGSAKTFKDINIGFRHPDERREKITVLSAKAISNDLLIGFNVALQAPLSDQEISQEYGIASGLPTDKVRTNEYEKGTIILDVADAETRTLIWRGALQAMVSPDIPDDVRQKRIDDAVKTLIDDFIDSNS